MFCKHCGSEIKEGSKFCIKCGAETNHVPEAENKKKFFTARKLIFSGLFVLILIAIFIFFYYRSRPSTEQINQNIASIVVNIYCEGDSEEDSFGGSGTIFSKDGLILTNAHIIPESAYDDVYIDETTCIVILPDPATGSPNEIYYAYPVIIPELSELYDLAFVQIHDVFYDYEEGKALGEYPKEFPSYTDNKQCSDENVKLGEPVRIYGYPAISGGYALTITDGVVSSLLPEEGLIITSAKISYGNSGGLAVDQNGCMIGVPSMVTGDENESLGVIISNDIINEFVEKLQLLPEE